MPRDITTSLEVAPSEALATTLKVFGNGQPITAITASVEAEGAVEERSAPG